MKYIKKPLIIDAFQWDGKNHPNILSEFPDGTIITGFDSKGVMHIAGMVETLEGQMIMLKGDYLITGIEGEIYPCKASIFEATYERIEE